MEQFEDEAKKTKNENGSGDLQRKAYSKPRVQVFGDLRTIIHGNGNNSPTSNDAPSQHHLSQ